MIATIIIIFCYMVVWFVINTILKNNGYVDIAWGLGFVVVAWGLFYLHNGTVDFNTNKALLLNICVSLWGLRLAAYLFKRNVGKAEDFRYAAWRKNWKASLGRLWLLRAFLQIYMLQGFFMFIIALPIIYVNIHTGLTNNWVAYIGVALFIFGFLWEAIADQQLYRFKQKPSNKGKIMMQGLWKFSRHPNYFGEAVLWWGIFLIALSNQQVGGSLLWWCLIISPITITILLTNVSGVPMLEAKYKDNPVYLQYIRNTNAFIPMPPKQEELE